MFPLSPPESNVPTPRRASEGENGQTKENKSDGSAFGKVLDGIPPESAPQQSVPTPTVDEPDETEEASGQSLATDELIQLPTAQDQPKETAVSVLDMPIVARNADSFRRSPSELELPRRPDREVAEPLPTLSAPKHSEQAGSQTELAPDLLAARLLATSARDSDASDVDPVQQVDKATNPLMSLASAATLNSANPQAPEMPNRSNPLNLLAPAADMSSANPKTAEVTYWSNPRLPGQVPLTERRSDGVAQTALPMSSNPSREMPVNLTRVMAGINTEPAQLAGKATSSRAEVINASSPLITAPHAKTDTTLQAMVASLAEQQKRRPTGVETENSGSKLEPNANRIEPSSQAPLAKVQTGLVAENGTEPQTIIRPARKEGDSDKPPATEEQIGHWANSGKQTDAMVSNPVTPTASPVGSMLHGMSVAAIHDAESRALGDIASDRGSFEFAPTLTSSDVRSATSALPVPVSSSGQTVTTQLAQAFAAAPSGRTELQLDPEELGRVTLNMVSDERSITLLITADRLETLDLLRRNIEALAQDFRELGFEDISFQFGGEDTQSDNRETELDSAGGSVELEGSAEAVATTSKPMAHGQLDIRL